MKLFFAYYLLFIAYSLPAQEVRFSFDKKRILLGEQLQMKVETSIERGENPDFFSMDSLPHFEVLDVSKIDTAIVGGKLQLSHTLTITSWDSGRWNLPSLITNGIPSKPVAIDVGYTTPWDPKKPYNDIKGIVPVKQPGRDNWWWYLIGAAVLIALFLLFFPGDKNDKVVSELDSGAYKKAMQALEKLQKDKMASSKQYYTELITIFRTYLKGAKGIQSFSKTTDDLSIQLQSLKLPAGEYTELLQTLRLSDLVKFAQYNPEERINTTSFNTIKQSITTIEQSHAV
ncbi:MAG: hypothetical protein JWR72_3808 [Flavisolibacter sp.]|jgi:hypothetical protein|nr:hypothetical protein [Flavisolibacter sp.]